MQGYAVPGRERQILHRVARTGHVPVDHPDEAAIRPDHVVGRDVVVAHDVAGS